MRQAQALSKLGPAFDNALLAAVRKLPRFVPGRLAVEGYPLWGPATEW